MPEVRRRPVKTIAAPASLTAAMTSSSRREPPGWTIAVDARVERELRAVGEREERIRGERPRRSGRGRTPRAFSTAIRTASTRLIWPAPIPIVRGPSRARSRSTRRACRRATRRARSPHCSSLDVAGDDLPAVAVLDVAVAVLDEHPAEHALVVALAGLAARRSRSSEDARVLLPLQRRRARRRRSPGAKRTSTNCSASFCAERRVDRAVEDDDPAVRRDGSEASALVVRLLERRADGDAARVRVLDDHARRAASNSRSEQPRAGEVVEVVERELLAVQLLDAREQVPARAALGVVRARAGAGSRRSEVEHLLERE